MSPPSSSPHTGMSGHASSSAARTARSLAGVGGAHPVAGRLRDARGAPRRTRRGRSRRRACAAVTRGGEQRVEVQRRSRRATAATSSSRSSGVAAADELAARVGVGDCELAAVRVDDVRRPPRVHTSSPAEVVPRAVATSRASIQPSRRPDADVAEREGRRAERAELLPRPARGRGIPTTAITRPRPGAASSPSRSARRRRSRRPRRAPRCMRSPVAPLATSAHSGPSASSAHSEIAQYGISREQFVEPSTGSTTTVIAGVASARPARLLAHDRDPGRCEHAGDRGVGDEVERVLARPVGPGRGARSPASGTSAARCASKAASKSASSSTGSIARAIGRDRRVRGE